MPVTEVNHDTEALSLTITAEFGAPVERVWELYSDPRQLEKVFGPPTHPATFDRLDLQVGGRAHYHMTGPEGEKFYGIWEVQAVDKPNSFTFEDGFADETYTLNPDLPVSTNVFSFAAIDGGTRATYVSTYVSAEGLQQVLDMGVVEGATLSINQIDDFLAG